MKARLANEVGTSVYLRRYWEGECLGGPYKTFHNTEKHLFNTNEMINGTATNGKVTYNHYGGRPEDYPDEQWPNKCDHCGVECPKDAKKQVSNSRLYDTPSGKLEPGCLYYAPWYDDVYWDNQST